MDTAPLDTSAADLCARIRAALRAGRRTAVGSAADDGSPWTHQAMERAIGARLASLRGAASHGHGHVSIAIAADFNDGSREREVMSALYHRYFGPRLTVGDLARHAGVHRRTMQRRLDEGYRRLASAAPPPSKVVR